MGNTQTYREYRGKETPFDWNYALNKKMSEMTKDYIWVMENYADSWVTCACGNQCAKIPRDIRGVPSDMVLRDLGFAFNTYVTNLAMSYARNHEDGYNIARSLAKEVLGKIERRSSVLLAAMENGLRLP